MASKVTKKMNNESKVVKCKNCRQDILEVKMFLHEGFCTRNNVFCDHCEKVFLKKDYEQHVKLFPKNLSIKENPSSPKSQKSKETQPDTLKQSSFLEENESISNSVIPLLPKPSLEVVQMPVTELYKINEPIFVNETGQIISNNNKNDYVLPMFGINFRSSKMSEKVLEDIIDQGDIFKENNTISHNCYDIQGLSDILNKNNYKTNTNYLTINSSSSPKDKDFSIELSNLRVSNRIASPNKNILVKGFNSPESKTIEINKMDSVKIENMQNIKLNRKYNQEKYNTICMNKTGDINSKKILNGKYNFLTFQETPQKSPENSKYKNRTLRKSVNDAKPLDKISRHTPKRKNAVLDITNEYDNYQSLKKEPKDSNSKRNSNKNDFKFSRFSGVKNKGSIYLSEQRQAKTQFDIVTCQYCHNKYINNKFDTHVQNCKSRPKKRISKNCEIPKPKKKKTNKNIERFIFDEDDETCLDEKKRETLTRQLNPSTLNILSQNCDNKDDTRVSNLERNEYSTEVIKEYHKISLKKNLFKIVVNDKKNFPEDSNREEMKTLKRSQLRKRLNNFSLDMNDYDRLKDGINCNRTMLIKGNKSKLKSGEIDAFLYFNNNKKVLKYPKDKIDNKNIII